MTQQLVELSYVLHLLPPSSAARLAEVAETRVPVPCVAAQDAGGTRHRVTACVGDRLIESGWHTWIAPPLVEDFLARLAAIQE